MEESFDCYYYDYYSSFNHKQFFLGSCLKKDASGIRKINFIQDVCTFYLAKFNALRSVNIFTEKMTKILISKHFCCVCIKIQHVSVNSTHAV